MGLLFRIAALGFVSVIPAKQKSHAVQISFNSARCRWEPNELHYQRRAAADAGQRCRQRRKGLQDISGLPFSLSPSPFCKPWRAPGRKSLQVTQRKSLKCCQEPLQAALSSSLSSALFATVGPCLGCLTCHSNIFPRPVLWSRPQTSQPIFSNSSSLAAPSLDLLSWLQSLSQHIQPPSCPPGLLFSPSLIFTSVSLHSWLPQPNLRIWAAVLTPSSLWREDKTEKRFHLENTTAKD